MVLNTVIVVIEGSCCDSVESTVTVGIGFVTVTMPFVVCRSGSRDSNADCAPAREVLVDEVEVVAEEVDVLVVAEGDGAELADGVAVTVTVLP